MLTSEAAMAGRSVNLAARMVRGLDPDCWFCWWLVIAAAGGGYKMYKGK